MSIPMKPGFVPRRWQAAAAEAARYALYSPDGPQWQSGVIVAATGTGKGDFLAGIAVAHALKGGRVVVVVDRENLVNDIADRTRQVATAHGLVNERGRARVGVCMAERNELLNPIVVASIQSLSDPARLAHLGKVSLLITDEAHGAIAPSHRALHEAIGAAFPRWKHIGLTATGYRGDGSEGLGDVFEGEIFRYGIADAVEAGDLVPIEDWQVATKVSLEGASLGEDGEYNELEIEDKVNNDDRNRLAWQAYVEHAAGKPALFFALNVKHAHELARMGREEFGVNAWPVHGPNKKFPLTKAECNRRIATYKATPAELPVLVSCDLIRVGFDAPETYAVVLCRPWRSLVAWVQTIGRGTRVVGVPSTLTDPAERRAAIAASRKPKMVFIQLVDVGSQMTLERATNLERADAEESSGRSLDVGDEVERRRHPEWGKGPIVAEVAQDGPLGRVVTVRWPPSEAHPEGAERDHAIRDLMRPRKKSEKEQVQRPEPAQVAVEGLGAYRLHLLPERAPDAPAVGWFEWDGTFTVSAVAPNIGRVWMHLRAEGGTWWAWSVRSGIAARDEDPKKLITTRQAPEFASSIAAMAWAEAHLRAHGATVAPLTESWRSQPASDGQRGALRALGVRRDLSTMSAGEASMMIDAIKAYRAVDDATNPGLAARRAWVRRQFRGGSRASA